jgi:hypothetical protein
MKSQWLRIVQDYPGNNVGPTVPFLIGALRQPPGAARPKGSGRAELRALLAAMLGESPMPWNVVIQPCGGPEKLVVTLTDVKRPDCIEIRSATVPGRVLYCHPVDSQVGNIDDLANALWNEFGTNIDEGKFSYVDGEWRPFSSTEVNNINAVLQDGA